MESKGTKRLINKGSKHQPGPLLEQARSHKELGRKHEAPLGKFGWTPRQTEELDKKTEELDLLYSSRSSATDHALSVTRTEESLRQEAKAFIRHLRHAVPMVIRNAKPQEITQKSFNAGKPLGKSTQRISQYLAKVRPFVKTLNEAFTPYFGGEDPSEKLEAAKSALDRADARQETTRKALPEETAKIYHLSGQVLEMIEDMNRVGKIAYDGQAEMIAQFNKDILLRGGRKDPKPLPETTAGDSAYAPNQA